MEVNLGSSKHVRFDPVFLKRDEERQRLRTAHQEEQTKLLIINDEHDQRSKCEQLFRTLTHGAPEYRDSVHQWYQGRPDFQNLLNASLQMLGIAMNPNAVGLNHDLDARLTLMGGRNFAHEYANSITFKGMFIFLSKYCSENNWPLLNKVTPTNSPGRRGRGQGGGDAGGNANGGGDEAGGNAGDGGGAAPVEA